MGFFKGGLASGILIGTAAGLASREFFPAVGGALRPLVRSSFKMGIVGYERMREAFAGLGESLEDMTAEVRSEMEGTSAAAAPAGKTAGHAESGRRGKKSAGEEGGESRQAG